MGKKSQLEGDFDATNAVPGFPLLIFFGSFHSFCHLVFLGLGITIDTLIDSRTLWMNG